jgi:hypothetical protein
MSDNEKPAEYQRTGAPGPGSPEYEAMDKLAKMFERQVDELRGEKPAADSDSTS